MDYRSISPVRLRDLPGPRRSKPPVWRIRQKQAQALRRERAIVQDLLALRALRIDLCRLVGERPDPLLVMENYYQTESGYCHQGNECLPWDLMLPQWDDLTEYMQLHLGFMACLGCGGFSFSADIHPHVLAQVEGSSVVHAVAELVDRELGTSDAQRLPYAFVLEGRTRHGHELSKVHLHGFTVADYPGDCDRIKRAFVRALHRPEGQKPLHHNAWKDSIAFDFDSGDGRGRGRWVNYMTKNINRYDLRIAGPRVLISSAMKALAQEMWSLIRGDPYDGPALPIAPSSELAELCMLHRHSAVLGLVTPSLT